MIQYAISKHGNIDATRRMKTPTTCQLLRSTVFQNPFRQTRTNKGEREKIGIIPKLVTMGLNFVQKRTTTTDFSRTKSQKLVFYLKNL